MGLFSGNTGSSSPNLFYNPERQNSDNIALQKALNYQGSNDALDPIQSSRTATSEVQNNGILGGLFGKGGTLDQSIGQEKDLAGRGYSLQPEDYEAYGQGSGNIAREFDSSEGNLAQALSNRGLSTSGVANQAFIGSQGNKLEQLGQLQRQIANDRMNTNMQRLRQMQNFVSQLGQQGQNAIQSQYGRQAGSEAQRYGETMGQANLGMEDLSNNQNQQNNQWSMQNASTEKGLGQMVAGGLSSALASAPGAAVQAGASALSGKPQGPMGK